MREIKFRARDNNLGKFYSTTTETDDYMTVPVFWMMVGDGTLDRKTLGQYTGLKDKNGKEIYESDILLWFEENITVIWDDDFSGWATSWGCGTAGLRVGVAELCEVIGNIYENPELLGAK